MKKKYFFYVVSFIVSMANDLASSSNAGEKRFDETNHESTQNKAVTVDRSGEIDNDPILRARTTCYERAMIFQPCDSMSSQQILEAIEAHRGTFNHLSLQKMALIEKHREAKLVNDSDALFIGNLQDQIHWITHEMDVVNFVLSSLQNKYNRSIDAP